MAQAFVGESSDYSPLPGFRDELFAEPGEPPGHVVALLSSLDLIGRAELSNLGRRRDQIFTQQGTVSVR